MRFPKKAIGILLIDDCPFIDLPPPHSKHLTTDFLSTDGWMLVADLIYSHGSFTRLKQGRVATHLVVFVETRYIDEATHLLKRLPKYILITSDHHDTLSGVQFENLQTPHSLLEDTALQMWWGVNAAIVHHKLRALPIGPKWEYAHTEFMKENTHRITADLEEALKHKKPTKSRLIFAKFTINTTDNPKVHAHRHSREKARSSLVRSELSPNDEVESNVPREQFLKLMAESRFCICPPGNGPDTHRLWEALHFDVVPVVLAYPPFERMYQDLPLLEVSSWDDIDKKFFETAQASDQETRMKSWNRQQLSRNHWKDVIRFQPIV